MRVRRIPLFVKILKRHLLREDPSNIHALKLRHFTDKLSYQLLKLGVTDKFVFSPAAFIEVEGVLLSTKGTDRYFHGSYNGRQTTSDALIIKRCLIENGINPTCIFDIGANYGEIGLILAKEFPGVSLYLFEPSQNNQEILNANIEMNEIKGKVFNLEIALSDSNDSARMSDSLGSEDHLISQQTRHRVSSILVETRRLRDVFDEFEIEAVDLVKIDIEGSEILLLEDLVLLHPRIKSIYMELGHSRVDRENDYRILNELYVHYFFFTASNVSLTLEDSFEYVENLVDIFMVRR